MNRSILINIDLGKKKATAHIIHVPEERITTCMIIIDRDMEHVLGGMAMRNPNDVDDPDFGMRLAARRALKHQYRWMLTGEEFAGISHAIRFTLRDLKQKREETRDLIVDFIRGKNGK